MLVWIDASSPAAARRVFGLTACERHLRSLLKLPQSPTRIVIDCGSRPREALRIPLALHSRLAIEFSSGQDALADRLTRFLGDAGSQPVLLIDGGIVADARLHIQLPRGDQALAAFGEGAEDAAAIVFLPVAERGRLPDPVNNFGEYAHRLVGAGIAKRYAQTDFNGFIRNLRRSLPFYLFLLQDDAKAATVERFLFWSNYKGSTDLFTRYVYPPAVWLLVRPLARARIHPNWVTIASIVMTFAAIPFFADGQFVAGFILAYGMSVLDSVDGKLARLTFTDSAIGNILDHGLDIVHPPLWYMSWAFGLGLSGLPWSSPLGVAAIVTFAFYVLDRLILKIYPRFFGRGFHTHSKLDATIRSVISRRNINLPVFLVGWALGLGVETFYLIAAWQVLTALYHGARTFWIIVIAKQHKSGAGGPAEIATKRSIRRSSSR